MVNNADTSQDTTIISNMGGTMAASPSQFDFVVLDAVSGQCGRGLRVVAAGTRRAIAWLTPSACCPRCLDVWAPTVVLGSHSNHVSAPSLRLSTAWFEIESGGWGGK